MKKIILWLLLLSLLAFLAGVGVVLKPFGDFSGGASKELPSVEPSAAAEAEVQREVVLYFGTLGVPQLAQQLRYIKACDTERECIMGLVQQLIVGPDVDGAHSTGLVPVLPTQTLLLDAEVKDETVTLNFNQALISYLPSGSSTELLAVHAIINTVAANLPHVREMKLLVDGKAIETLHGHVDLREPVVADFSLVRQENEVSTVEPVENSQVDGGIDDLDAMHDNTQSVQTGEYRE